MKNPPLSLPGRGLSGRETALYFQGEDPGGGEVCHSVSAVEITGNPSLPHVNRAYGLLQAGNPELRKRWILVDGKPCWDLEGPIVKQVEYFDLINCISPDLISFRLIRQLRSMRFDLFSGNAHRCWLIRLDQDRSLGVLAIHRLIGDDAYAAHLLEMILGRSEAGDGRLSGMARRLAPLDHDGGDYRKSSWEPQLEEISEWLGLAARKGAESVEESLCALFLGALENRPGHARSRATFEMASISIRRRLGIDASHGCRVALDPIPRSKATLGESLDKARKLLAETAAMFCANDGGRISREPDGSSEPEGVDFQILITFEELQTYDINSAESAMPIPVIPARSDADLQFSFFSDSSGFRCLVYFNLEGFPGDLIHRYVTLLLSRMKERVADSLKSATHGNGREGRPADGNGSFEENEGGRVLLDTCRNVFGNVEIGPEDDLWEMGADSLKLLKVVLEMENRGYTIGINSFYTARAVAAIANEMAVVGDETQEETGEPIHPMALTPFQINYFRTFNGRNWNLVRHLELPPDADSMRIQDVLTTVCRQHEALRARFYPHEKEFPSDCGMRIEILPTNRYRLDFSHLDFESEVFSLDRISMCVMKDVAALYHEDSNLVKFFLVRFSDRRILSIVGSHLIFDANSLDVLTQEIEKLCSGKAEKRRVARFTPYSKAMNALYGFASGPGILEKIPFWVEVWKRCSGNRKLLSHGDASGPDAMGQKCLPRRILLEGDRLELVDVECGKRSLNLMDVFLSILRSAMAECYRVEDLGVSLVLPGRNAVDLGLDISGTIGSFSSTAFVALGCHDGRISYFESAKAIRESRLHAGRHSIWEGYLPEIPYYHRDAMDRSIMSSIYASRPDIKANVQVNYLELSPPDVEPARLKESIMDMPFEIEENSNLLNVVLRHFGSVLAMDWIYQPKHLRDVDAFMLAEAIERKFAHAAAGARP